MLYCIVCVDQHGRDYSFLPGAQLGISSLLHYQSLLHRLAGRVRVCCPLCPDGVAALVGLRTHHQVTGSLTDANTYETINN
jgi:hypothetical protein